MNLIAQFLQASRDPYLQAVKRILRYIRGTINYDLYFSRCTPSSLISYFDVDWVVCPDTRRLTSSFCGFFGSNIILWSAKNNR